MKKNMLWPVLIVSFLFCICCANGDKFSDLRKTANVV
jgi:hypothetical protein